MPRSSTKSLTFPLAGVSARGSYRQQTRPFSAPWAVNVRTFGPSESRARGGSRPGLDKFCPTDLGTNIRVLIPVTYVDSTGTRRHDLVYVSDGGLGHVRASVSSSPLAELEGPDGVDILLPGGDQIVFGTTISTGAMQAAVRGGKVYFADTVLKVYDPDSGTVEPVLATAGTVPTGQPVVAVYRGRIFLAGSGQDYICSRMGYPGDWDHGAAREDVGRSIAGQLSTAADIGDVITAMIPVQDRALVLATETTLWVMRGDPATGTLENVSEDLGIVAANGWAMSPDGLLAFLSADGVYLWDAGSRASPQRFSAERVPDELRDITASNYTISMAYDSVERGFHLFLVPSIGEGTHWWIDAENKAFWPQRLQDTHQPLSCCALTEEGLGYTVIGSQDGYLRYFKDGQADDDGEDLGSHVLIGPVRLAADDVRDGLLAEITGVMEDVSNTGNVTWRVVMGRSAAEATEAAIADLNTVLGGQNPVSVAATGTWTEGRNLVQRPRARGAWLVVWLSSTEAWSYEVIAIVARQVGRHR